MKLFEVCPEKQQRVMDVQKIFFAVFHLPAGLKVEQFLRDVACRMGNGHAELSSGRKWDRRQPRIDHQKIDAPQTLHRDMRNLDSDPGFALPVHFASFQCCEELYVVPGFAFLKNVFGRWGCSRPCKSWQETSIEHAFVQVSSSREHRRHRNVGIKCEQRLKRRSAPHYQWMKSIEPVRLTAYQY